MEVKLNKFQYEFMNRYDDELVIASCGVGSGKSKVGAMFIVRDLLEGHRILCCAQTYSALSKVMYREIELFLNQLHIPYTYNKSSMEINVGNGVVFGFTSVNPQGILGMTDINTLVIDEAGYCSEETYQFAKDRLRGQGITKTKTRLLSSPDNTNSVHKWFIDLIKNKEDNVIYGSSLDNGFTSEQYKKDLLERYPVGTPLYEQQILGHIIHTDLFNVIIKECDIPKKPTLSTGNIYIGVDCSGSGRDATVYVVRNNSQIIDVVKEYSGNPSTENAILRELNFKYKPKGIGIDDTGGFGKNFHLLENDMPLTFINFGSKSSNPLYPNKRTEMYFNASRRIKDGFYINNKEVLEELSYTTYTVNDRGLVALVPKELIKKQINRSPDTTDALVCSFECEQGNVVTTNTNKVISNVLNWQF